MAKTPKVHVTDHAVVRYLERVVGIDVEDIRRRITAGRESTIAAIPKGELLVSDRKMKLAVINGTVVSVFSTQRSPT